MAGFRRFFGRSGDASGPADAAAASPAAPAASRALEKLQGFHDLARDCLSRAVAADEAGKAADAVRLYQMGIEAMAEGLALPLLVDGLPPAAEKQRKALARWQSESRDRLRALESSAAAASSSAAGRAAAAPPSRQLASPLRGGAAGARPRTSGSAAPTPTPAAPTSEDAKLRAMIESDIVDRSPDVHWADIAGLEQAKRALHEAVVLPTLRADLFTGLRAPARGLLLFGPPGTGKTLLAKAVATESGATFFAISAASLTSKWVGEAEKLVRALFAVAAERAPSVVFIDEIDAVLSARSSGEHEASRRLKTEFLVQMDGVAGSGDAPGARVVVLGATNRPEELDEAVRRRLVKRILIPLPDAPAREALLRRLLSGAAFSLPAHEMKQLVAATEGYSGSDLAALCREAALAPLRELGDALTTAPASRVRPLAMRDCTAAMRVIRPSVDRAQLAHFEAWDREFGARAS